MKRTTCTSCGTSEGKYRCRMCTERYCSAACYRAHQQTSHATASGDDVAGRPDEVTACATHVVITPSPAQQENAAVYDDAIANADQQAASSSAITRGDRRRSREDDAEEDEEGLTVLRSQHLAALANDPSIRNQLKTSELKTLLRIIDNSRSRLDALDSALHNVPEFRKFCNDVMQAIRQAK